MLDSTTDSHKLIIACRFIQHDQWLTTHVDPQWTIRQLKLWLVHRLFGISIPARTFTTPPQSGQQPERPPSPITFAPDPRNRPASPIIFATPQKSGLYGSVGGGAAAASSAGGGGNVGRAAVLRGILSDTDEDLLSGSESGFSSAGKGGKGKGKGRMDEIRIETGPPGSGSIIPGGRIGPSHAGVSDTDSITSGMPILPGHPVASPTTSTGYTAPDADRFPGGVNPHHWTLTRYSTGQIFGDDEQLSWYDIAEFELVELHGLSFPSTHSLYEYQVCHLWNQDRHRERERLRKKLKKRFEAEVARDAKEREKDRDGTGGFSTAAAKRAFLHAQILKAMNLNSGAGANVGVVEYYGSKLASTQVELTLTRIPRSIDTYVQPYWEGWVRTLRIVWRGDWDDIAFANAAGSHSITIPPHHPSAGIMGTAAVGAGGPGVDPYKYGAYAAGAMIAGMGSMYHGPAGALTVPIGATRDKDSELGGRTQKIVRVEWRERWVRIQNGILAVLKDREDEDATHVLPLKCLRSIHNTQHLTRYLSYTGFNPPRDHPSVNRDILMPALDLPIPRPPLPTGYSSHYANSHSHSSKSKSSSSSTAYNHAYPDSDDSESLRRRHPQSHGNSSSGHGHHGSFGGSHQPYNFNFPSNRHLTAHVKARELTPLVGSRFDPTYLPITIEEQKASGLRVVCLQFRKYSSVGSSSTAAATGPSSSSHSYYPRGHDGVTAERERGGGAGKAGDKEHKVPKEKEPDIDPTTLALEDMRERAGEWGGIRSNSILWKCPNRLRREPPYLVRARVRTAKIRSLGSSGKQGSRSRTMAASSVVSDARSSTIRELGGSSSYYDLPGHNPRSGSGGRRSPNPKRISGIAHKERHYEREQRRYRSVKDSADVDMHAILAAQIFGGTIPGSGKYFKESLEEKERKEKKEMRKREKELEKERAKQEKKGKGKGKEKERDVVGGGGRKNEKVEKDWNLGSLNVGFLNWNKKKRAKKEEEQLRMQRNRQQELADANFTHSNNNSTVAFSIPTSSSIASSSLLQLHNSIHGYRSFASASVTSVGTGISTSTVTDLTNPTASSATVVGGGSRGGGDGGGGGEGSVETGAHSSEDDGDDDGQIEFAHYHRSERSGAVSTEDDDEEEEEEEEEVDDDDDDDDDEEELDENDENVVEPYPDTIPEIQPVVEVGDEEDGLELIEYANQPSATSMGDPSQEDNNGDPRATTSEVHQDSITGNRAPNLVLQITIDKHVETELSDGTGKHTPNTVIFGGRSIAPSPLNTSPPVRFPPSPTTVKRISIDTNIQRAGSSASAGGGSGGGGEASQSQDRNQIVSKKPSQRLIGQLHSSGEENGEEDPEQENEEEELSSPVFAPPPPSRRRPFRIKSPAPFLTNSTRSTSSQGSYASIDAVDGGRQVEEVYDFDDDLELEDEVFGHRRAGYRYGSYDIKRDEDRRKKAEQLEEEKEKRIKELREREAKERERERMEKERERERRERRKKEEEGEWVCLDIGNDYAFQSFLRIVHQHCPHPMKSTFMDRMAGGPLNDAPPPPQNLPQPLITNANAGPTKSSIQPGGASVQLHNSPSQSQIEITPGFESALGKDVTNRHSIPNSPTSLPSHRPTSPRASATSPPSQTSVSAPVSPAAPSIPGVSSTPYDVPPSPSPSEGDPFEADNEMDSEAEYVAPLPGYGDPRFVYPSRTFATPPYPEWRINVMRKAQHAGMGDIGRAMEFIHWGRDDPVIANASGAVNDLEKMGRLWGSKGGVPGLPGAAEKGMAHKRRESGWSDNVSSLGTIGPRTVGSGGTVKGVQRSPREQRKRLSLRSPRSPGSVKGANIKGDREGGESGNESSREASDGSAGGNTSGSDVGKTSKSPRFHAISDLANRLSNWSDDEEQYTSELEWTAWHIDIPRQSKRQYAIEERRKANATPGVSGELDLGIPVDPADDMKRYLKNLYDMEPRAKITKELKPPDETATPLVPVSNTLSVSRSVGHSSTATSITSTSPPSRIASDALNLHHARTPSQQHPILHHSASLHTGLRKGAQESPLRRPSMPILNPEKDKGKGKERSFWNIAGFSATNDEIRSPVGTSSGWFSRKEAREREMVSPIGTASQPTSAGGTVARSGNVLLKGGLLRKKDSSDVNRGKDREKEDEKGKMTENERESKKGQRPQLWVATSSGMLSSSNPGESSRSPEQVRSPTAAHGRLVRRMQSDGSILSTRANDPMPEPSSPRQGKKKKGMVKLLDSLDFVEGK